MSVAQDELLAELQWELSEAHSGLRFEILRGQVVLVPAPTSNHDRIAREVFLTASQLTPEGFEAMIPGAGVWISDSEKAEYCQPDTFVSSTGTGDRVLGPEVVLAVEVISPSNRRTGYYKDAVSERALRFGMGWILLVDTDLNPREGGLDLRRAAATGEPDGWITTLLDHLRDALWT